MYNVFHDLLSYLYFYKTQVTTPHTYTPKKLDKLIQTPSMLFIADTNRAVLYLTKSEEGWGGVGIFRVNCHNSVNFQDKPIQTLSMIFIANTLKTGQKIFKKKLTKKIIFEVWTALEVLVLKSRRFAQK